MAINSISSAASNQWQLVSTVTPTSGTSVTFSSLAGYKKYLLVAKNLYTSTSNTFTLRINGDTAQGSYTYASGDSTSFFVGNGNGASPGAAIWATIDNADKPIPHEIEAKSSGVTTWYKDYYVTTSAVTSITLATNVGSYTFDGGTIYLYGIAA